jgi:hypothetical protein
MEEPDPIIFHEPFNGYVEIGLDPFFTRSRIRLCKNEKCIHNRWRIGEPGCNLREVEIDGEGMCSHKTTRE